MSRGRSDEALAILAKYHANGNAEDPLVRFQFAEMKASIALGEQKGRWSDLVSTTYYLHNILLNIGIDSPNYQNMLNGFILMVNMFEAWFWACMVDRFGRRPLFLICSTGMVCTFATWIALTAKQLENPKEKSWGKGVIAMIFFHNFFYNFAWPSLGVSYPLEILSFKIRANGLLMQNISTYVCLAISQYS
ncbi:unnamed protein product [Aureobasidium vineae]|uniref:Sugar transporter n=1 Tax=Aureobasidium vineae TaxID=2773715 RepID=A0A9N8JZ67_9PEZI|nr:unnamed protein product [Aureobasidium vineae]